MLVYQRVYHQTCHENALSMEVFEWESSMKMPRVYGDGSKPWYLVNLKIAGKWMFIPLKMVLIDIDPYPYNVCITIGFQILDSV